MDECDVVVPRDKVAEFIKYTHDLQNELNVRIKSFGHAGDGNLHVYVLRDNMNEKEWNEKLSETFNHMYGKARVLRGQVSGEHGIGYAKKEYLHESQSEVYMNIIKNIKSAFDPKNLLNPGKIY